MAIDQLENPFDCISLLMTSCRYYAIVHPMRAKYMCTLSQARKVITGIWVSSFLLASPTVWIQVRIEAHPSCNRELNGNMQIHLPVGERVPAYWCVRDWDNPLNWQVYELYMLTLVLIVPLSVMAAAYGAIAREIWRVTYLRSAMIKSVHLL